MGQGRGRLREQAFQGEGMGGEAWWGASEDDGMWVWFGRGDSRPTGSTVVLKNLGSQSPGWWFLCGQQHSVNVGSQGDCVDTGRQRQLRGSSSNVCAMPVMLEGGYRQGWGTRQGPGPGG